MNGAAPRSWSRGEAAKNRTSINAELVSRIEKSFEVGAIRSLEEIAADIIQRLESRYRKAAG
jgi:N-acetyl-anhydromuramyl-L-alanine amidase AmpD